MVPNPNHIFLAVVILHPFFHHGLLDLGFPFSTTYNQYRLLVGVCPFLIFWIRSLLNAFLSKWQLPLPFLLNSYRGSHFMFSIEPI